MFRLSVVSSLSCLICRSLRHGSFQTFAVRGWSSSSDRVANHPEDSVQGRNDKKCDGENQEELSVWPDADVTMDSALTYEDQKDDDITATWSFSHRDMDVEPFLGMANHRETHVQAQVNQLEYANKSVNQVSSSRSMRDRLLGELPSEAPDDKFLVCVQHNLSSLMNELNEISQLLKTLNCEDNVSRSLYNATVKEDSAQQSDQAALKKYESANQDETTFVEITPHAVQSMLETLPALEDSRGSDTVASAEDEAELQEDTACEVSKVSSKAQEDTVTHNWRTEAEALKWLSSGNTQKSTPSRTDKKKGRTAGKPGYQRQPAHPKEKIHIYRPFRTIEVPLKKPN